MEKYDVIVVGGGFSGIASAIATAREGNKVLLKIRRKDSHLVRSYYEI